MLTNGYMSVIMKLHREKRRGFFGAEKHCMKKETKKVKKAVDM